ncbi:hypothetical protein AAEJ74_02915 [Limnospira fusiformis PMC 851.14]|uniref:Uncharacterized protein n=1 Tax=Limnospira fusiformis PMC 851.14 TaxID=2219512 RepID=A0ABU9EFF1_LIMFS
MDFFTSCALNPPPAPPKTPGHPKTIALPPYQLEKVNRPKTRHISPKPPRCIC